MANLTIKDVPEKLHKQLKKTAKLEGRSLNSHVIGVLKLSEEEHARRQRMREGAKEYREFMKSLPYMGDSTPLIREDREHGHD
jgi:plasmid stability protein